MQTHTQISVAVAGAAGKMGTEARTTLHAHPLFKVTAVLVRSRGQAHEYGDATVYMDAEQLLAETRPDVWLDFTDADSVVKNVDLAVRYGSRPVVGATGYQQDDLERWDKLCRADGIGGIAAPNFAVGALLMIRFAQEAARFLPHSEIVELHHDGKKDAPSGTAKRTALAMNNARGGHGPEVPIHSVRLPGLVAHQEVIFGGTGEVLTIRHDSLSRSSFMPGVVLACEKVMALQGMVYGLEHILW